MPRKGFMRCILQKQAAVCLIAGMGLILQAGCSTTPSQPESSSTSSANPQPERLSDEAQQQANEIVLRAMGLLNTHYQFGGRNPDAGLDCSGMVSLVVEQATGRKLPHNAAQIAAQTREIARSALQPGDLVFFNTSGPRYSHMGIYLGEGRFVHAPSSKGRVRVELLNKGYFAQRFSGARSLF